MQSEDLRFRQRPRSEIYYELPDRVGSNERFADFIVIVSVRKLQDRGLVESIELSENVLFADALHRSREWIASGRDKSRLVSLHATRITLYLSAISRRPRIKLNLT